MNKMCFKDTPLSSWLPRGDRKFSKSVVLHYQKHLWLNRSPTLNLPLNNNPSAAKTKKLTNICELGTRFPSTWISVHHLQSRVFNSKSVRSQINFNQVSIVERQRLMIILDLQCEFHWITYSQWVIRQYPWILDKLTQAWLWLDLWNNSHWYCICPHKSQFFIQGLQKSIFTESQDSLWSLIMQQLSTVKSLCVSGLTRKTLLECRSKLRSWYWL